MKRTIKRTGERTRGTRPAHPHTTQKNPFQIHCQLCDAALNMGIHIVGQTPAERIQATMGQLVYHLRTAHPEAYQVSMVPVSHAVTFATMAHFCVPEEMQEAGERCRRELHEQTRRLAITGEWITNHCRPEAAADVREALLLAYEGYSYSVDAEGTLHTHEPVATAAPPEPEPEA